MKQTLRLLKKAPKLRYYGIEWMACDICVCYMKYVMCCVLYEQNDNACYSHSMTFLI